MQEFLAGNGEITTYCNIPYQKATSYLTTFKGLQGNDPDLNIGDELKKTSNFVGSLSPDHTTFGKTEIFENKFNNRLEQDEDDLSPERYSVEERDLQAFHVNSLKSYASHIQW